MKTLLASIPLIVLLCLVCGCQDQAAMAELEAFRAQAELEEKNVNWIVVGDYALDRVDENRFSHTYRRVWDYIRENFEIVEVEGLPALYKLYRRVDRDGRCRGFGTKNYAL